MSITLQVTAVVAVKLIADEIQRRRHMAAAIDIGVVVALIVDENRVEPVLLADQPEFLDRARPDLLDARNHPATIAAFSRHAIAIAHEYPVTDRQADQIDNEKNQR